MDKLRFNILGLYILLIPFDNFRLFPFSISSIIGLLYIVLCFEKRIVFEKKWLLEFLPFYFAFSVIGLATILFVRDTSINRTQEGLGNAVILYLIMVTMLAFVVGQKSNLQYFRKILWYLFVSVFIASLTGLYELYMFLFQHTFVFGTDYIQPMPAFEGTFLRIRGTYFDPNYYSVLPMLGVICTNELLKNKLIKILLNVIFVFLILTTFSRMGVMCIVLYYSVRFIPKRLFLYILVPTVVIFLPVVLFKINEIADFMYQMNEKSADDRMLIISGSIEMIKNNPIIGYGFNTISPIKLETHNTFLQVLLYGGFLAFFAVYLPIAFCYYKISTIKSEKEEVLRIKRFLISSMYPFLLAIFFISYITIKLFWIYLLILFLGKNLMYYLNEENTSHHK